MEPGLDPLLQPDVSHMLRLHAEMSLAQVQLERTHPRSGHWPAVRAKHLEKQPTCQVCGRGHEADLNVHHIKPYHLFRELELEQGNLITLCNGSLHHLWFGHFGNFVEGYNLAVVRDCAGFITRMALRSSGGVPK